VSGASLASGVSGASLASGVSGTSPVSPSQNKKDNISLTESNAQNEHPQRGMEGGRVTFLDIMPRKMRRKVRQNTGFLPFVKSDVESKVTNETTHNLRVADQKILSD